MSTRRESECPPPARPPVRLPAGHIALTASLLQPRSAAAHSLGAEIGSAEITHSPTLHLNSSPLVSSRLLSYRARAAKSVMQIREIWRDGERDANLSIRFRVSSRYSNSLTRGTTVTMMCGREAQAPILYKDEYNTDSESATVIYLNILSSIYVMNCTLRKEGRKREQELMEHNGKPDKTTLIN